jgi:hypothetical protein
MRRAPYRQAAGRLADQQLAEEYPTEIGLELNRIADNLRARVV